MEENCDDKSINTNTRPSLSRMSSEKEDEINRYLSDNNEDDDLYLEEEPSFLVSPQITRRTKARKSTNKKKKKSSQVLTDALLLDTSHISLGLHSVNSSPEASDASVSESEKLVAIDVNVEADAKTKADGLFEEASSPYVFKSKRFSSLGSNSNSGRLSGDEDTHQSQRRRRSSSIASASSMKSSSDNDLKEEKQTSDSTIATTIKNESAVKRGSFSQGSPLKMLLNSTSSLPKGAALKNLMASPPLKSLSMNLLQRRLSGSGASGTDTVNNEKNNNSVRTALMKTPERKRSLSFGSSSSTTGLDSSPSYKQFFQSLLNLNKENNNNVEEQQQPKKQKGNKSNNNDKATDAHPAANRDSLSVSTTVSGEGMTNTDNANTPKNFKKFMEKSYSPIMTFYSGSEGGGSSHHSMMMSQDTQTTNTSDGLLAGENILMMSQEETEQNQLKGESKEQDKVQLNNDIVKEKRSKIPSLGPSSHQEQQTTKRRSNIQPPSASTIKKTLFTKKDLTVETENLDAFIGNLNKSTTENNKEEEEQQQESLQHSRNKTDIGNELDDMNSPEMMELSEEPLPPSSQLSETTNDHNDEKMHESPTEKNNEKDDRGKEANNDLPQHSVVTGLAEEHQEKREAVEASVSISHKNFSLEDLQNVQNFVNASSHSLKEKLQHSSYLRRQKLLSLSSIDTTNSSDGDANSNNAAQQQQQNSKRRSSLESFSMYNEENDYYDVPKKKKPTNQHEKKKPELLNNKHYSSKRPASITTLTISKNETTTTTLAPMSNTNKSSTPKSSMMVMGIGGTEGVPKIAKRPPTIPISPKLGIRKSRSPSKAMKKIKKEFVQSKKLLESISRENKQHYLSSPQIKCPPRSIIPRPPANLTPEENPYKPFKARPILHHLRTKQTKKKVINGNSKSTGVKKQGVYKPFEARPLPSSSFSSRGNVSKVSWYYQCYLSNCLNVFRGI